MHQAPTDPHDAEDEKDHWLVFTGIGGSTSWNTRAATSEGPLSQFATTIASMGVNQGEVLTHEQGECWPA
ncbi:MAG TPA: hypothetical protein H9830_11445 [Candidatus Agrococcus pullicola]|uniref:Uncharacterized protein n=1 Tax=Candidatus Agrococcus pullicola TaxID=2838429 RepID=A0A9D1YW25_9MICO|nr:hypothetical protein [Candidatus Agrococcus pullicola]